MHGRKLCAGSAIPFFAVADVGFKRRVLAEPRRGIVAMLWETDPERFAACYHESGIIEPYGDQWPQVTCIDFWVYVDGPARQARTRTEGWSSDLDEPALALTGDGARDGLLIAAVMAGILRVPPPAP
jgi:hypothetical protein